MMGYVFQKKTKTVWYENRRRWTLLVDPVTLEEGFIELVPKAVIVTL
jgi:hypothetical protein